MCVARGELHQNDASAARAVILQVTWLGGQLQTCDATFSKRVNSSAFCNSCFGAAVAPTLNPLDQKDKRE